MTSTSAPLPQLRSRVVGAFLVAVLLLAALPGGQRVGAGQRSASAPLDLAAMTLVPSDLPEPGFALAGAQEMSLTDEADRLERARGDWRSEGAGRLGEALAAAGWQRRYESRLAAPDAQAPGQVGATVVSAVTAYADAAGAATGFALLASDGAAPAARTMRGVIAFGDESRITRTFVPGGEAGRPVARLELTVQLGALVAAVAVTDLTGKRDWGVVVVEGLAAALLARIEAVRAGEAPGLAPRLLRLDEPGLPAPVADVYDRRDGETFPLYGVDPEDAADREGLYGAATDVYTYEQVVPTSDAADVPPYYAAKLYRFPDTAAAAGWLESAPERLFEDPGSFLDLVLVEDAAIIGEASRTISYAFPASDAVTTRGYRVYARVGNEVARVQLDGEPEVTLGIVEAFARVQVTCLAAPACAEPPPVPLDRLIPATPAAP